MRNFLTIFVMTHCFVVITNGEKNLAMEKETKHIEKIGQESLYDTPSGSDLFTHILNFQQDLLLLL